MFLIFLIIFIRGCQISGYESGMCVQKESVKSEIEFCFSELDDYVCVPKYNTLWPDHTTTNRDIEIRTDFINYIRDRLVNELNESDEAVLLSGYSCFESYKSFLCQWNFPPCDTLNNQTKSICQSYCTNYYSNCGLNLTPCLQEFETLQPGLDSKC